MDGEDSGSLRLSPVRQRQRVQQQPSVKSSSVVEQPIPAPVSVPPDLAEWIKLNANDLKISQRDRRWAAEMVNDLRDHLLKFLKKEPLFQFAEFLNTGSYFEKVKIYSPDEFDMMLKVPVPSRFTTTKLDGGLFYRIDFVHAPQGPIRDFLLEDQLTLSSTKLLTEMFRLVRKFLKTYRVPDNEISCHWEVNRKKPSSPAVTLSLCRPEIRGEELISVDVVLALESQSWPPVTRNGPDVDRWLGKKSRQEIRNLPCYFVPKKLKGRNQSENAKESWRISFSHIEKKIITSHGNKKTCCESHSTKCCRKPCLMLLKSLIEGLKQRFPKELDELCSYHGKTVFLHTLAIRFDDSQWACQQLPVCFLYLVDALQDHARQSDLPHFFVPECNLFSPTIFHRRALAFLVKALDEQKREGLPLLKPPTLVSPLKPATAAAETILEKPTEKSSLLSPASCLKLILLFFLVLLFVFCCFGD